MSSESFTRNEEGGNTYGEVHPIYVPAFGIGASSRGPSRFDLPLLRTNDDRDLATFIAKYQDALSEDVIINLGAEESSDVPCSRKGFNEFQASHIVKRMRNGCYYISPRNVGLIQCSPQGEKG
ncbi:hypothetical protein F0562_022329 [Nyssa sinensis]|uniref:Uncharacterized protein n=1 Tax=Nyssa sinensis TaxID=561372 RepID=A0A5J5BRI1_9ASTE|nr:hypothetical protein F0562_022329 [Nyssa sinensis]